MTDSVLVDIVLQTMLVTAKVVGPSGQAWKGRNKPHRGDRAWVLGWSPEQIAARLPIEFPDDESMRISHEAIYQARFVQGRGALSRELVQCRETLFDAAVGGLEDVVDGGADLATDGCSEGLVGR